jgi:CRP-like cAMP-binding protein
VGIFLFFQSLLAVVIFVLVFKIKNKSKATTTEITAAELPTAAKEASGFLSDLTDHLTEHATILVSWMQILSAVTVSADAVDWPPAFTDFAATLSIVNLDLSSLVSVSSCSLILPNHVALALHLATPPAVIVSMKLSAALAIKITSLPRKYRQLQTNLVDKIVITITLLLYPSISTRLFKAFRCFKVEDAYFLEADFSVKCWDSPEHSAYVAVSILYLIAFIVGVPLLLLWEMWRNRVHLHNTSSHKHAHVKERLGSVYAHFEPAMWWFECCVIVVKMLLAGAISVIAPHSPLQLFVGLIICMLFLLLVVRLAPYRDDGHDIMLSVVYISLTFTLLIGALKSAQEYERSDGIGVGERGDDDTKNTTDFHDQKDDNGAAATGHQWANLDQNTLGAILVGINILPFLCLGVIVTLWVVQRQQAGSHQSSRNGGPNRAAAIVPVRRVAQGSSLAQQVGEQNIDNVQETGGVELPQFGLTQTVSRTVSDIMAHHEAHAREHSRKQEERQALSKRKTMQRVEARAKLKRSRKMKQVEIFQNFDDATLSAVIDKMTLETFRAGETIVAQGEVADAFFIITKGACNVRRKTLVDIVHGQVIGRLGLFEHFGEAVLVTAARRVFLCQSGMSGPVKEELRNATVEAAADNDDTVQVLRLSMEDVERVLSSGVVDMKALQKRIEERHENRELLTSARRVWQGSEMFARLRENRGVANAGKDRSLFE